MTVLVVEDYQVMWQWLSSELEHRGWVVHWANTAGLGLAMARRLEYDTILLDIMLPDFDGLELCRKLRTFSNTSIIMLTARHQVSDRVDALNGGADDYLVKPFAIEELVARIHAIRRRTLGESSPGLSFGDLRLFPEERIVEQGGEPLTLGRREFDLLAVLMTNPNRVLSRDTLLEKAWGYDFYGESNVVDVTVRRLRDHLRSTRAAIITVRGVGYCLKERNEPETEELGESPLP